MDQCFGIQTRTFFRQWQAITIRIHCFLSWTSYVLGAKPGIVRNEMLFGKIAVKISFRIASGLWWKFVCLLYWFVVLCCCCCCCFLYCVAVLCTVLCCVAVLCTVLCCVAVRCTVLCCVAVLHVLYDDIIQYYRTRDKRRDFILLLIALCHGLLFVLYCFLFVLGSEIGIICEFSHSSNQR